MQTRPTPALEAPAFTERLLDDADDRGPGLEIARFGWGLGLASIYGLALGLRAGGTSLLLHAVGVPLGFLAVGALGVPALLIVLTVFDASLSPRAALRAVSVATVRGGLLLAGIAPAVALYVTSSEAGWVAAACGVAGLFVGGAVGLASFTHEIGRTAADEDDGKKVVLGLSFAGFGVFAILLALRVWWSTLPLLGGAS